LAQDVEKLTREYEAILGTTAESRKSGANDQISGSILHFGTTWMLLTKARSPEETQHLMRHGQGPFQVTLRCHDGPISPAIGSLIDPELMCGARVALA
jgi:hypothetical protein